VLDGTGDAECYVKVWSYNLPSLADLPTAEYSIARGAPAPLEALHLSKHQVFVAMKPRTDKPLL
jgi:hypothetical protein